MMTRRPTSSDRRMTKASCSIALVLLTFVWSMFLAASPNSYHKDNSNTTSSSDGTNGSSQYATPRAMIQDCPEQREAAISPSSSVTTPERDFLEIAARTGTDKVKGELCTQGKAHCNKFPEASNPQCAVAGHFYHTLYNRWLGEYSRADADPFQFLEIGFYKGSGFEAYSNYLSKQGELHSMEISCIEAGPRAEGKWPWGNFAISSSQYNELLDSHRLHCGDASAFSFLESKWKSEMKRPDAPPLKIVIDDASHLAHHMATSLFYWFPKIAPGGLMFVEDIQPSNEADKFRTHVLPQIMKDLHYCGDNTKFKESACFPTLQPLLASIHCELHICVFERNSEPAVDYDEVDAMPPKFALNAKDAPCMFG